MASTRLERTNGTATTRTKCTFSAWFKYDQTSGTNTIINTSDDSNANTYFMIELKPSLDIQIRNGSATTYLRRQSLQVLRDNSGWYNVVVSFDSTDGTPADRLKVFLNGERITGWENDNGVVDSDYECPLFKTSTPMAIGSSINDANYFSGIMSHMHATDGYVYDASAFGETDSDTGEWKIKTDVSVTYGDNGFFILEDGNSVTDQSGEGNNWTVDAGTLTNTEDCPSDIFATMSPLDRGNVGTAPTFANANDTWTSSGNSTGQNPVRGTLGITTGKFYWEAKTSSNQNHLIGVCGSEVNMNYETGSNNLLTYPNTTIYLTSGGAYKDASEITSGLTSIAADDIMMIGIDMTNLKFYIGINGTWLNSADPVAGTNAPATLNSGSTYLPVCADYGYADVVTLKFNFGNGYFGTDAISSEGTNASNIGKFEYNVPTGFTALSTKGLNS